MTCKRGKANMQCQTDKTCFNHIHTSPGAVPIMFLSLLFYLSILSCVFGALEGPRANSENGPLVGTYETSQSGYKYKAFKGIPYAEPPVGKHRFKEAQRIEKQWIGEWNAQSFGSPCLQLDHFTRTRHANGSIDFHVIGDEDCLFLNVFSREGGPAKKDVIFAIHGGAFTFGAGHFYDPQIIMDRDDIVYVSINYRLGPLGFLTTGDSVVPGNNGLKDQVAALEWVNRNIASFGGDPKKITIIGLSAGGASVDYMYLTPLTKGLFQRGYSYSGTSLCSWAFVTDGVEKTKKLAEHLGCPSTDSEAIVKCLRRRPAQKIVEDVKSFMVFLYNPYTVFGPVVELNSARPYIDQTPRAIYKKKLYHKLPWIAGVTTEEGLYPAADFIAQEGVFNVIDKEWEKIGPSLLFINPKLSEKQTKEILHNVRQEYFGDKPITIENRDILLRLMSERLFDAGIMESAMLRDGTYLYLYGHQGEVSTAHCMADVVEDFGAAHGDDIFLVVKYTPSPQSSNPRDKEMAEFLKNILYTFVKNGKVPEDLKWKPWSESKTLLKVKSPNDISITDKVFVDLKLHKKLYKEVDVGRDEL